MKLSKYLSDNAQPVADTFSVLEIYTKELINEGDDTATAKNVKRALKAHHKALLVASRKLGLSLGDEASDGIVAFSSDPNKDEDDETPPQGPN